MSTAHIMSCSLDKIMLCNLFIYLLFPAFSWLHIMQMDARMMNLWLWFHFMQLFPNTNKKSIPTEA